jgi:hypothetical protein
VSAGTTSDDLPLRLQDLATDLPPPVRRRNAGAATVETLDVEDLLENQDAWIDSVSSMITGLASAGTSGTRGSAPCVEGTCPSAPDGMGTGMLIALGALIAGAVAVTTSLAKRRLNGSGR